MIVLDSQTLYERHCERHRCILSHQNLPSVVRTVGQQLTAVVMLFRTMKQDAAGIAVVCRALVLAILPPVLATNAIYQGPNRLRLPPSRSGNLGPR